MQKESATEARPRQYPTLEEQEKITQAYQSEELNKLFRSLSDRLASVILRMREDGYNVWHWWNREIVPEDSAVTVGPVVLWKPHDGKWV